MWIEAAMVPVLIISVLCILVEGQGAEGQRRGEPCEDAGVDGVWHGPDHTNGYTCCKPIMIEKGFEVIPCSSRVDDTDRRVCEPGTYQNYRTESYHLKDLVCKRKSCSEDREIVNWYDTKNISMCKCNLTGGYFNVWGGDNEYRRAGLCRLVKCEAGTQLNISGLCEPCPIGTFKSEKNSLQCNQVTPCPNNISHTPTTDTICGKEANASKTAPPAHQPRAPSSPPTGKTTKPTTELELPAVAVTEGPYPRSHPHQQPADRTMVIIVLVLCVALLLLLVLIFGVLCSRKRLFRVTFCFNRHKTSSKTDLNQMESESSSGTGSHFSGVKFTSREESDKLLQRGATEHDCNATENDDTAKGIEGVAFITPGASSPAGPTEGADDSQDAVTDSTNFLTVPHTPLKQQMSTADSGVGHSGSDDSLSEEHEEIMVVQGGGTEPKTDALVDRRPVAPPRPPTDLPPSYDELPGASRQHAQPGPTNNYFITIQGDNNSVGNIGTTNFDGAPDGTCHSVPIVPTTPATGDADETQPKTLPPYPATTPAEGGKLVV